MSENFYRIVLLPPPEVAAALEKTSQNLCGDIQNYTLGFNSVAHVTLCHVEVKEGELPEIWDKISKLKCPNISTTEFYTHLVPSSGNIYMALRVSLTDELMAFHEEVCNSVGDAAKSLRSHHYNPHYTLGLLLNGQKLKADIVENSQRYAAHSCKLAIGISSPVGPVPQIIYQQA